MFETIKSISLTESITHIEDLGVSDFIARIENLSKLIVSEKLDGANLWMGFDLSGVFYTTRAGKKKGAKNFYSTDDYPNQSAYSGFKAAHLALEKIQKDLAKHIKPGQACEVEILFGRQPNAVTYGINGKSYIAFIRPVEGEGESKATESDIDSLSTDLEGKDITVNAEILTSEDGEKLEAQKLPVTWQVVKTQTLDSKELKTINFSKEIKELKKFLNEPNSAAKKLGFKMTNAEVMGISLTKIPKEQREQVKELRTEVNTKVLNDFKLPIKEKLLTDFVRKIKPKLQGTDLDDSEDTGVEGVVARDPETGEQFKIVDKDVFTTVNTFNWGVRAAVDGLVKTDDPTAAREMRGGAVGDSKIRIADLFGMRELAKSSTAKRYITKFKGKNEFDTAKNIADNISNLNFNSAKTKIRAILSAAIDEVGDMLKSYKKEVDDYKVELKNGKIVKYSPEVKRRTLTSFAEVKTNLLDLIKNIDKTDNFTGLILALYGNTIKAVFDAEEISESLILSEATAPDLSILKNMSAEQICLAYQATLLGSLLLLRAQDRAGLRLIRDPNHATLKKYDKSMSQLNFWGLVLFNPDNKDIKPHLQPQVFKQLWKIGHRFLISRIKNIHGKLSKQNGFIVDWDDQAENLRVVTLRFETRDSNTNLMRDGLVTFPDLSIGDKEVVVSKIFYNLMQHAPTSPLISRVREFANKILLTANIDSTKDEIKMSDISKIKKLKEDGEGGGEVSSVDVGSSSSGGFPLLTSITSSGNVGTVEKRLFKNKMIIRRKRGYEKPAKFERPKNEKQGDSK